jgi:hypothetical protein
MAQATLNAVNPVSTPAVVVATPSFNVDKLGEKAKVVVSDTTLAAKVKPFDELVTMETARISWETTELAQSNNRKYGILYQAYKFYLVMKQDSDKDVRKAQLDAMEKFIADRGYTFTPSTHDMTRVVKCVFGVERRRVSAYSIALREALRQEVEAEDLVAFLEDNGGVEQIRLGGTKPLSATKRAEQVKGEVLTSELGKIKCDVQADADWTDKQVVLVATYLPTGEFEVNAVVKHDGAVNAALAAYYSQQMAKVRADAKSERDAIKLAEQTFKAGERQKNKEAREYLKNNKAPKKKMTKEEKIAFAKLEIERIADRQAIIDKLFEYIE